jgi:hypothetical protein
MRFFKFAASPPQAAIELGEAFAAAEVKAARVEITISSAESGKMRSAPTRISRSQDTCSYSKNFMGRLLAGVPSLRSSNTKSSNTKSSSVKQHTFSGSLSVTDFDLLRVVGKGAFGKVMLVRKKHGHVTSVSGDILE